MEIDFETANLDLAEDVLEVANDCNPNHIRFKVDINVDMTPLMRDFLKAAYPDIEESMIETYVQEYRKKEEAKKETEENRKKEIKAIIRERIRGEARIGWELAYRLCGDSSDNRAKRIRYETCDSVPDLSVSEKIKICEQYLPLIEEDTNLLAKKNILWRLAELKAQKAESQEENEVINEEISYYLEQYYKSCADQIDAAERLIQFCKNHKLTDELGKWQKTYLAICQQREDVSKTTSVVQVDSKILKPESVYQLISLKLYDDAELELDRIAEYERQKNEVSHHMAWVESLKYRMKYYRLGYSFLSKWNVIYFYDYINANDKDIEKRINELKKKYWQVFSLHRRCLTDFELFDFPSEENEWLPYSIYYDACEQEIEIIPQILGFIDDFRQLYSAIPEKEGIYNIHEIMKEDKYKLANCIVFKKLAIYYEKNASYDDAIRVCDKAISCGYLDDGTKLGMIGRKNKILKKKAKEAKKANSQK